MRPQRRPLGTQSIEPAGEQRERNPMSFGARRVIDESESQPPVMLRFG